MAQDKKTSDEILKELFNSINDIVPSSEGSDDEGSDVEKKLVVKKEKRSKSSYDSSYSSKSKHKKKKKSKKSSTKYSLHFSSEKSKKSSSDKKSSSKTHFDPHSSGIKTEKGEKSKVKTEKELPLIEVLKKEVIEKEASAVIAPPEIELPPLPLLLGAVKVKQEKLDSPQKEAKISEDDLKKSPDAEGSSKAADEKDVEEEAAPKVADVFMEDLMDSGATNLLYGPAEKPKKTIQINLKGTCVLEEAAKAAEEKTTKRKHEDGELSDSNLSDVSSTSDLSVEEGGEAADGSTKKKKKSRSKDEKDRSGRKKKKSKHGHKDRKDEDREKRRAERLSRRSKDGEGKGERSVRRRSRSRSRTSADLRHRSSWEHRRKSRTRSRDRSSKRSRSPSSRDKSKISKTPLDRDEHRSKRRRSRERSSRSRSRDRGKSRHKDKAKDEYRIDKGKLLEIARKNALRMLNQGQVGSDPNKVVTITAGGKTVDELTDFCKHLSRKEASGMDSLSSESSSEESEGGGKAFHHPFKLKERPSQIIMNIRNMPPLPVKTFQEKATENLRLQFPVSSGQHHRKTEGDWVPVSPKRTDPTPSTSKSKKPESGPKAIEAPPLPPSLPASAPIYPTVYPKPADRRPIDIGAVISERLAAIRNETDTTSSAIYRTGGSGWGDSSSTGAFTGSTGARILTPNELASGQQAWAKKKKSPQSLEEGEASSSSSSDSFSMSEISSDEEGAIPKKPLSKVLPLPPPTLPEPPLPLQKPPLALKQPPLRLQQPPVLPQPQLFLPQPQLVLVANPPVLLPPSMLAAATVPPILLPDVTRPPPPIQKTYISSDEFCRKFGGASSELPDLMMGQRVIVTDMKMNGTVLTKIDPFTYLVQTDQGKLKCDRFYLVPIR